MMQRLKGLVPGFLKRSTKKAWYYFLDAIDVFRGRDSMVPPRSTIFVGAGDFEKTGQEFRNYFVDLANLQPASRVLDVGCGQGRMAVPLTGYLRPEGEYWGFDIVKKGIDWCQSRISSKYPNFRFVHCDVYNKHYNPEGKENAESYRFPFDDQYFDFVFLTSVFTHMFPRALENYLGEISRVLKSEGKCLLTFFLLNEESRGLIQSGRSTQDFRYEVEGCLTIDRNDPEAAIAFDQQFIETLLDKHGLKIVPPIHSGSWCRREAFLSYQDIVIATKA